MLASARVFVIALLLTCAVFQVGFSQENTTGGVVTTKRTLKTLLAGVNQALDDFTCDISESTPASCTDHASSLNRIEEAVGRIEDTLSSSSTSPLSSSLEKIAKSIQTLEDKINDIADKVDQLQEEKNKTLSIQPTTQHATNSCAEIYRKNRRSPSGYYQVASATGHPHRVYCDMTRSCGGVTGGWMRVAYLDMTNITHHCPRGLSQHTYSGKRTCNAYTSSPTCSFTIYPAKNIRYSNICGKIIGYHSGSMNGFTSTQSIETQYVDGISLTHGRSPRQHIWTFAVNYNNVCPCKTPPLAVGNDFFCDVGGTSSNPELGNPLWDGIGCNGGTCCNHNRPPWFHKQLPQPTTDDIEMRVCRDQDRGNEDVSIESIEIYVQ